MYERPEFYKLNVKNLQINYNFIDLLDRRGIKSIGAFIFDIKLNWPTLKQLLGSSAPELASVFRDLQRSVDGRHLNWIKYWRLRGFSFFYLYADCWEFKSLPEEARRLPLDSSFGAGHEMLATQGIVTVGNLVDRLKNGIDTPTAIEPNMLRQIMERLVQLCEASNARKSTVCKNSPPGHAVEDELLSLPIEALNLGVKEQWLKEHGVATLSDLQPFLHDRQLSIPKVGPTTLRRAATRVKLLACNYKNASGLDWASYVSSTREEPNAFLLEKIQFPHEEPKEPSEKIRKMNIEILYLGVKEKYLKEFGINYIGDFIQRLPVRRGEIPKVGPTTVKMAEERVNLLTGVESESGEIEVKRYLDGIGVKIIPSFSITSTEEFLSSMPAVFSEIEAAIGDDLSKGILSRRLCCLEESRMTLEEVAQVFGGGVTRERVRQKEAKLLSSLADGLLSGFSKDPAIYFPEEYRLYWQSVARRLEGLNEISLSDLISAIGEAWGVETKAVEPLLPLILPIVSGEITTLRADVGDQLGLAGLEQASEATLGVPVSRLCWGLVGRKMIDHGYENIGDILDGAHAGSLEAERLLTARLIKTISAVSKSISSNGDLDWEKYAEALEVPLLPKCDRETKRAVLENLISDLGSIIGEGTTYRDAEEIFRLRTSQVSTIRPTLQAIADRLKTHQPSVKRIETEVLGFLNDSLVRHADSQKRVLIRPSYLRDWADFADIFAENPSFADFELRLRQIAGLDAAVAARPSSAVWAVLNGYPYGRKAKSAPRHRSGDGREKKDFNRIVLRGFRRTH